MSDERYLKGSCVGLLLTALSGCGKAVDLDRRDGLVTASADPSVLGVTKDSVVQLVTDDHRLYWSTDAGALRGCEVDDCAGTVTTYAESEVTASAGIVLSGGELFFVSSDEGAGVMSINSEDRGLRQVLQIPFVYALAADDLGACVAHYPSEVTCVGSAAGSTPVVMDPTATEPRALTLHGDQVYWLAATDGRGVLQRAARDGSGEIQTLATGLRLDRDVGFTGGARAGLVVDDQHVYFSENVLSGAIRRCPRTGCDQEPESLLAPLRVPSAIWLVGETLYAEHELDAYRYAVFSCDVDSCEPRQLADRLASKQAFVLGRNHTYVATTALSDARPREVPGHAPPAVTIELRRFFR